MGKCPECGSWNSMREFKTSPVKASALKQNSISTMDLKPKKLSEVKFESKQRILTGFSEMDGTMGGGIMHGSVTLLAGDPGIGKSTLLLQTALNVSSSLKSPVLYISAEESEHQIKQRAGRIIGNKKNDNLLLLSLSNTDAISDVIANTKPSLVIIDSIQMMESENLEGLSGSLSQVRYAGQQFIRAAKSLNIPIIIVGHVTKEGMVAGPMILSHMVDTVLFLEGEKFTQTRILRSLKNRFGPVDEVGIFKMDASGITEVKNPEQIFLSKQAKNEAGRSLVITLEGTRAFIVEVQALVVFSRLPMPRRVSSGFDYKRLELLLAVLQKHSNLTLDSMDVFVNIAGGLKLSDPAADLGICLAIYSSLKNIPVSEVVGIAEVGLLGELRDVQNIEKRLKEAKKLGFRKVISSKTHKSLNEAIKSASSL
jgi:DNA repair protein RadA/Sms